MKIIGLIITLIISVNISAANRPSQKDQLANYINQNKEKVLKLAQDKYEYTYFLFNTEAKNCIAKKSAIGPVGMCLITAKAREESVTAYYSVNVTSDYSGTGDEERKFSITLIDYEL